MNGIWHNKPIIEVEISGDSMSPDFCHGQIVRVDTRYYKNQAPQIGHIILALHPYIEDYYIVKKIVAIEDDKYFLQGINKDHSTDSRSFGPVPLDNIVGRVI